MSLARIYRATQVAASIHQLNYACEARMVHKMANVMTPKKTSSMGRLGQAIKLGALGGADSCFSTTSSPAVDNIIRSFLFNFAVPEKFNFIKLKSLGTWHLTTAALTLSILVGTGSPNILTGRNNSACVRLLGTVMQYGILGLPQAYFIRTWDTLHRGNRTALAGTCLMAAIITAVPLETARVALVLALSVGTTCTSVITGCAGAALGAVLWATHHNSQSPADYVWGLHRGQRLNASRAQYARYNEVPPGGAPLPKTPQANARMLQQSLDILKPVLTATSQQDARAALMGLNKDLIWMTENLEMLTKYCNSLIKEVGHTGRSTFSETGRVFAADSTKIGSPAWVVARYRKLSLYLHPDKLSNPGQALPPDTHAMAVACFGMLTSLRDLHEAFKI